MGIPNPIFQEVLNSNVTQCAHHTPSRPRHYKSAFLTTLLPGRQPIPTMMFSIFTVMIFSLVFYLTMMTSTATTIYFYSVLQAIISMDFDDSCISSQENVHPVPLYINPLPTEVPTEKSLAKSQRCSPSPGYCQVYIFDAHESNGISNSSIINKTLFLTKIIQYSCSVYTTLSNSSENV